MDKQSSKWRERWEHFVKSVIAAVAGALVALAGWVVKQMFGL
jgi:hypothetical protein